MNGKAEILMNLVADPGDLFRFNDLDYINSVVSKYPFFQTGQLIRSIVINHTEGLLTNKELSKSAVYAGNRVMLYNYLQSSKPGMDTYKWEDSQQTLIPGSLKGTDKNLVPGMISEEINLTNKQEISSEIPEEQNVHQKTEQLIDKFIRSNPSIQKPMSEFYSASTMAAKSLQDSEEFVTETLAEIFVRQENYHKAIKIYKKLSLLFPEKSDKFAVLIENLKNKITE